MQLSAANLLIASQQIARGVARVPLEAQAQFTAALAKEKGVVSGGFEPMDFRQSAGANAAPTASVQAPTTSYNAASLLGANLDIRV